MVPTHNEPDPETWDQIVLQWNQTVRSGTYELYELTTSGTWRLITTKGPNGLPAFNLPITHSIGMRKVADGSKTLYNHFKVVAQNSSGLVSADKRILTIPTP